MWKIGTGYGAVFMALRAGPNEAHGNSCRFCPVPCNLQPETRNLQPETRNLQPETRNLYPET
jgi:hypothetical protein